METRCGFGPTMTRDNHPCSRTDSLHTTLGCSSDNCMRTGLNRSGGMRSALRMTPLPTSIRSDCPFTARRLERIVLVTVRFIGVCMRDVSSERIGPIKNSNEPAGTLHIIQDTEA